MNLSGLHSNITVLMILHQPLNFLQHMRPLRSQSSQERVRVRIGWRLAPGDTSQSLSCGDDVGQQSDVPEQLVILTRSCD